MPFVRSLVFRRISKEVSAPPESLRWNSKGGVRTVTNWNSGAAVPTLPKSGEGWGTL